VKLLGKGIDVTWINRLLRIGVSGLCFCLCGCGDLLRMKSSAEVIFKIDRESPRTGEELTIRFTRLVFSNGRHYWAAFVPEGTSQWDRTGRLEVLPGTTRIVLRADIAGPHEIRIFSDYRGDPDQIIAWRKITVLPEK
jgi:hypothetical protein